MTDEANEWRDGMPFFGGSLWIDFLNTTPVMNGESLDYFSDVEGLARWARAAGIVSKGKPSAVELKTALETRNLLRKLFDRLAERGPISARQLEPINRLLGSIAIHRRLAASNEQTTLVEETVIAGHPISATVAQDFARFVCDADPSRMRRCANPECVMVFYDRGRNNSRRWCTMAICGNRDKVAQYRSRKKAGK